MAALFALVIFWTILPKLFHYGPYIHSHKQHTAVYQRASKLVTRGGHICISAFLNNIAQTIPLWPLHPPAWTTHSSIAYNSSPTAQWQQARWIMFLILLSFQIAPLYRTSHNQRATKLVARVGHVCISAFLNNIAQTIPLWPLHPLTYSSVAYNAS